MLLLVDKDISSAARWALGEVTSVLKAREESVREVLCLGSGCCVIVGEAGQSAAVDQVLAASEIAVRGKPESLVIHRVSSDCLVLAGRDGRGLM